MKLMRFLLLAGLALPFAACSSPQSKTDGEVVDTQPKEEGPECLQGCYLNSAGKCVLQGNVMDWSSVEKETIECDARCCQGAPTTTGATDGDGDGVFGDADQCPDAPEDRDNFKDEDGCPEPDNDGDGILDADDVCALDAEDVDGFQDEDGCPDP